MSKIIENTLMKNAVEFKVGRVYMYDAKTGIEYATATVKTSEMNSKADQTEVKGGKDNDIIYIIDKPKTITLTVEDVISDQNLFALKMGDGLKNADSTIYGFHMPDLYNVTTFGSDLIVTLADEPKAGEDITFTNPLTGIQISSSYIAQDSINKKVFKITDPSISSGDAINVGGFKFVGKATDKYFNVTSSSSVNELFVVVEIPLVSPDMTEICDKQYIFSRCKLSASTDLKNESDPKEIDAKHEITVLKPTNSKYLGQVYYKFPSNVAVTPISDLAVTSTIATEADLTFSAPVDADNVDVEYRLSTDNNWSLVNIGGSTGVHIANAVYETDTTSKILGLTTGSSYQFRLVIEGGEHEGVSNVSTVTVA